jgi:transcriptional regulator with XRE-family HTH domain
VVSSLAIPLDCVRTNTQKTQETDTVMRVSTDWPREAFFEEFDRLLAESDYRNEYALAQAAGISHSTLSSWRSGRQRPSTKGLAAVARALGTVTALELWELAGLVAHGTAGVLGAAITAVAVMPAKPKTAPKELFELAELYEQLDEDGRRAVRTQLEMAIMWAKGNVHVD